MCMCERAIIYGGALFIKAFLTVCLLYLLTVDSLWLGSKSFIVLGACCHQVNGSSFAYHYHPHCCYGFVVIIVGDFFLSFSVMYTVCFCSVYSPKAEAKPARNAVDRVSMMAVKGESPEPSDASARDDKQPAKSGDCFYFVCLRPLMDLTLYLCYMACLGFQHIFRA